MSNCKLIIMYMLLSFRCIPLSYHMIGERAQIQFWYFSEFRNLVSILGDTINLSREQATQRILEESSSCSMYVYYLVYTIFETTKLFLPTNKIISISKLQVYYAMCLLL